MHSERDMVRNLPCLRCEKKGRCLVCEDGSKCFCYKPDQGTWGIPGPIAENGGQMFFRDPPANPNAPVVVEAKRERKPKATAKPVFPVGTSGELDRVYSRWLELCPLTAEDLARLASERGLDAARVAALRIGRLPDEKGQKVLLATLESEFGRDLLLKVPGILLRRGRLAINAVGPGLLIPVGPPAGEPVSSLQLRLDDPQDGERYRLLSGGDRGAKAMPEPYVVRPEGAKRGVAVLTEGWSKALAASDRFGALAVGIPGVSQWALALAVLKEAGATVVVVAWDADHKTKPQVFKPLKAAVERLRTEGYTVRLLLWPAAHKGIDDACQAGAELEELQGDQVDRHLREVAKLLGLADALASEEATAAQAEEPLGKLEAIVSPVAALGTVYRADALSYALRNVANAAKSLDAIDRAALLPALQAALKANGIPSPAEVARQALGRTEQEREQEGALRLLPQEPCSEPVNGSDVLDEIEKLALRFLVLPDWASVALPLWILHTYLIPHLDFTPRLAIQSPVKRCGKSKVVDLVRELCEKPMPSASLTAATIFRSMDAWQPTIVADEGDAWLKPESEDLRGVVNTGFDRGNAYIGRCVGDNHETKLFATFGAIAIAGIGSLPDTIQDRSIVIPMRRKRPDENVERVRLKHLRAAAQLIKPRLARWAADHGEEVGAMEPELPRALHDRAADCWEPLLAIADLVGGEWPKRARQAALALSGSDAQEDEDVGVMLLIDIRHIFERRRTDRIRTQLLLEELCSFEERPWCEWKKGQPLSPRGLARLLGRFGVVPKPYRDSLNNVHKGYLLPSFEDAFGRYLGGMVSETGDQKAPFPPDTPSVSVTRLQPSADNALNSNPIGYKNGSVTDRNGQGTAPLSACNRVTDRKPPVDEKQEKEQEEEEVSLADLLGDLP